MDYLPISYIAISFLLLVGCIGTCAIKCIALRNTKNDTHEYTIFPQMHPPQYEINNNNNNNNNLPPPPYKLESNDISYI